MNNTRKIVLSALFSALSVALIYFGSFSALDLTMLAVSAVTVTIAVIEMGGKFPFLIYAVTGILSLLIVPNKETALIYVMLIGYYPMAKAAFERLHPAVSWILKMSLFNTSLILIIAVAKYALGLPETELAFSIIIFVLGNITFVLCDIVYSRLILLYIVKIRPRLKFKNLF